MLILYNSTERPPRVQTKTYMNCFLWSTSSPFVTMVCSDNGGIDDNYDFRILENYQQKPVYENLGSWEVNMFLPELKKMLMWDFWES